MNATTADINYSERVEQGIRAESQLIQALARRGIKIQASTFNEDMYEKIDAWITDKNGKRHSVQIKYRENGTDIIFEIIKDIRVPLIGRDMQCVAEYYLLSTKLGDTYLFHADPIKTFAKQLMETWRSEWTSTANHFWNGRGWEMKKTVDRENGKSKLMGYFRPTLFNVIVQWKDLI